MSAGSSLGFPGGRTLAMWWRQLAGYQPAEMWVGYLTIHRVEATVGAFHLQILPPFEQLVFRAFALDLARAGRAPPASALHLPGDLVERVLCKLEVEGLITSVTQSRELTEAGRHALVDGAYLRPRSERRVFYYWTSHWHEPPVSRFVPLAQGEKLPWLPAPEVPFRVESLHASVEQASGWKASHGFPAEVCEVKRPERGRLPDWNQVVVAAPQRLFVAVVRAAGENGPVLMAFSAQPHQWNLQTLQPAFAVPDENWLPCPSGEAWRAAFEEWCGQRHLDAADTEACTLSMCGERLLVRGPASVEDRVRSARGEAWIMPGDLPVRPAARLEVAA
jgi:hypothetical protein